MDSQHHRAVQQSSGARRRAWLIRLGAALFGIGAALLILEGAFRIFLVRHANSIDRLRADLSRTWGGDLTLFDIVRPSRDHDRVYEMIPGANGTFAGAPLTINERGFRDRPRPVPKPAGVRRVAILGDSIAFGWGVAAEERYGNRLENLLNADATTSTARWEVLNFAVPGYNSMMELATLRSAALEFSPDLLVVGVVPNDDELPNFVRLEPEVWSVRRLFIIDAIRDRGLGRPVGDTARLAAGGIVEAGGRGHGNLVHGTRPEEVPPEYRHLMGMDHARSALTGMGDLARTRGIPAVAVIHSIRPGSAEGPGETAVWKDAARKAGFALCDPHGALVAWARENRAASPAAFSLSETDMHPNRRAHAIIAGSLAETIRVVTKHQRNPNANPE